jgi:hypothetical protein
MDLSIPLRNLRFLDCFPRKFGLSGFSRKSHKSTRSTVRETTEGATVPMFAMSSHRPAMPSVSFASSRFFRLGRTTAPLTVFCLILLALGSISPAAHAQSCPGYTDQPLISVPSGVYTVAQMVTLADAQSGAVIYYTTDGSRAYENLNTPSPNATVYTAPFEVSKTETVSVIALAPGYCINYYVAGSLIQFNTPAQDFSISVSPASLSVDVGKQTSAVLTVNALNGFNSQIAFSCSGSSQIVCDFSPLIMTPSGASTNVQLTVIGIPSLVVQNKNSKPFLPLTALAGLLCLFGVKRRRGLRLLLFTAVAFAGLGTLSACGGSGSKPVPPGTVTVTAMMTNVTVSELQHTTSFSVQ